MWSDKKVFREFKMPILSSAYTVHGSVQTDPDPVRTWTEPRGPGFGPLWRRTGPIFTGPQSGAQWTGPEGRTRSRPELDLSRWVTSATTTSLPATNPSVAQIASGGVFLATTTSVPATIPSTTQIASGGVFLATTTSVPAHHHLSPCHQPLRRSNRERRSVSCHHQPLENERLCSFSRVLIFKCIYYNININLIFL